MNWSTPQLTEVNMSAEIGAYQGDSAGDDSRSRAAPRRRGAAAGLAEVVHSEPTVREANNRHPAHLRHEAALATTTPSQHSQSQFD